MTTTFTAGPKERYDRSFRRHVLLDCSGGFYRQRPSASFGLTSERAASRIVTTDEVLTEYLTFFATAPGAFRRRKWRKALSASWRVPSFG